MEYTISFTDLTLSESAGFYEDTKINMKKQLMSEGIRSANWTLRSNVSIEHDFGVCLFVCEFKFGGIIRICGYRPSSKDIHNNDTQYLKYWSSECGWNAPELSQDAIDAWPAYWKNQWETHIVDSEIFENKFGKRPDIYDVSEDENEPEDE